MRPVCEFTRQEFVLEKAQMWKIIPGLYMVEYTMTKPVLEIFSEGEGCSLLVRSFDLGEAAILKMVCREDSGIEYGLLSELTEAYVRVDGKVVKSFWMLPELCTEIYKDTEGKKMDICRHTNSLLTNEEAGALLSCRSSQAVATKCARKIDIDREGG